MHDYVCFIAPTDYCVELSLVYKTVSENCSHFILKWFQPNSFGEVCLLEESYKITQKIQILKILRAPSIFDIREYAFNVCFLHNNISKVI